VPKNGHVAATGSSTNSDPALDPLNNSNLNNTERKLNSSGEGKAPDSLKHTKKLSGAKAKKEAKQKEALRAAAMKFKVTFSSEIEKMHAEGRFNDKNRKELLDYVAAKAAYIADEPVSMWQGAGVSDDQNLQPNPLISPIDDGDKLAEEMKKRAEKEAEEAKQKALDKRNKSLSGDQKTTTGKPENSAKPPVTQPKTSPAKAQPGRVEVRVFKQTNYEKILASAKPLLTKRGLTIDSTGEIDKKLSDYNVEGFYYDAFTKPDVDLVQVPVLRIKDRSDADVITWMNKALNDAKQRYPERAFQIILAPAQGQLKSSLGLI
jgi:hypothetical protein